MVRRRDRSGGGACGEVAAAACGPLASALLGIAVLITDRVVYLSGLADPLVRSLAALAAFNIVLAAANLAPAAPMDGGRLLRVAIMTTGRDVRRGEGLAGASGEVIGLLIVTCGFVAALADGLADAFTWILVGVIVFAEGRGVSLRAAGLPAGPAPDAGPQPLGAKPLGPKPLR